jgi:polyhydroxyalkanoate synthesis regulator phasin
MATSTGKKSTRRPKVEAGKKSTRKPKVERSADRADKSVEAFREALERSVTLPRERIQEVVDDAVKRGRMTRDDANDMVSKLVSRGRKQSEELVKELEALLDQARTQVGRRTTKARRRAKGTAGKVAKGARDAADEPLAQIDKVRRKAGVGPSFPITGYDELTAAQINRRLADMTKPDLRKVRTYERNNKARKSVLAKLEKALG